jgi:glutamate 5-kinase
MSSSRAVVASANLIVVKIGTALVTASGARLDRGYIHDAAAAIGRLMDTGRRIVLVSSGAVGAGAPALLGSTQRPTGMRELQAAAAVGQPLLMHAWREAFEVRARPVAQVLVGRGDFDSRGRFLNIANCIACLLERGVVPIVNENDTVATEEMSLGDNDVLAARLAACVRADLLAILTSAPGVERADGTVVAEAAGADELASLVRADKTGQGRGGMKTKLEAARIAGIAQIATVIGPGRPAERIEAVLSGAFIGTLVRAGSERLGARRRWIALGATPVGDITLDPGAAAAVTDRGASLLAKGIAGVSGAFGAGSVVRLINARGAEIARGLTNLSSDEIRLVAGKASAELESILGRRAHTEVVHRDNLALAERRPIPPTTLPEPLTP